MKLEVGMFYRYKGQIGKYKKDTELDNHPFFTNNYLRESEIILLNNAKFSYNIIDILEVGDYVNGDLVLFAGPMIWDDDGNVLDKRVHINHNGNDLWLKEEYIKSIVTHEQMEQMAYIIEKGEDK